MIVKLRPAGPDRTGRAGHHAARLPICRNINPGRHISFIESTPTISACPISPVFVSSAAIDEAISLLLRTSIRSVNRCGTYSSDLHRRNYRTPRFGVAAARWSRVSELSPISALRVRFLPRSTTSTHPGSPFFFGGGGAALTDGHSSNDIEFYMLTRDKNGKTAT